MWTSPVYDYGAGDDEGGVDDSEDDGKEDYPGPLALLHPYITCRLICTPMAGVVTTGTDWYGNFGATVKNKNGVTYGDVMHALARQCVATYDMWQGVLTTLRFRIANVHDVSEMMVRCAGCVVQLLLTGSPMCARRVIISESHSSVTSRVADVAIARYFEGFEYSDGMVPHLSFHFGS